MMKETHVSEKFFSEVGLQEFVRYLDSTRDPINWIVLFIWKARKMEFQLRLQWFTIVHILKTLHSYVNNINTHEGGTHLAGYRRALTRTLKKYADESGLLKKVKFEVSGDDFREGLTAVISVKVMEPQFEGQTKTKLGNKEVTGAVDKAVGEMLTNYLEENPKQAQVIVQKVILAATARNAARKARDIVQRKNVLSGSGLPGKLSIVLKEIRQNVRYI